MSEQAAIAFSIIWLSAINLCWLLPLPKNPWAKLSLWLVVCLAVLGIGYGFESYTRPQPHTAWQTPDIYLAYFCASLFFSFPGFLLWRQRKK